MARVNNNLCKTNQLKVTKWLNNYKKKYNNISDEKYNYLESLITSIIKKDSYSLKECSEKNIVEYYINHFNNYIDTIEDNLYNDEYWDNIKQKVRTKLAIKYTGNKTFDNNIDIYFNEVKAEYIKTPFNESDNLEFTEENYDVFIKNNLKLVIECAKRYQNLGLPFEDLIQAGNEGLLKALKKYKKNKANLRLTMIDLLKESPLNSFTYLQAVNLVKDSFSYSKNLEVTLSKIPKEGFKNKIEFEEWITNNIKAASFASVAFMWIRAYIIIELNSVGNIIHVPQSAQKNGENSTSIIRLDSINPHTDDCYHDNQTSKITEEEFVTDDENLENIEKQNIFKKLIDSILYKLPGLNRRIIKKKYGIGYPYELSINDIAESENISINKVKTIINNSLTLIMANISARDRETIKNLLR